MARMLVPSRLLTHAIAVAIALALIPVTPAGTPIIAASVACLLGLRRRS